MSSTYTTRVAIEKPANGDDPGTWDTVWNGAVNLIDGFEAIGALAVRTAEKPSSTLNVSVSAGTFRKSDGTRVAFAGNPTFAVGASATSRIWLTDAGVLTSGGAFPADSVPHVRLATVVAGASTISSITDAREPWTSSASPLTSGANQAAITDGSTGTASFAIAAISDVPTANAVASLARQVEAIRAALIATGQIKGGS